MKLRHLLRPAPVLPGSLYECRVNTVLYDDWSPVVARGGHLAVTDTDLIHVHPSGNTSWRRDRWTGFATPAPPFGVVASLDGRTVLVSGPERAELVRLAVYV
jgi:hypothetical protein